MFVDYSSSEPDSSNRFCEEFSYNQNHNTNSSDELPIGDSMIRIMLNNNTPKDQSIHEDETNQEFIITNNNNQTNCNNNVQKNNVNDDTETLNTAKDVLEDIQKYFLYLDCSRQ